MGYTSIEQSKKLISLGLNPETADMNWEGCMERIGKIPDYCKPFKDTFIPCWSVTALFGVIRNNLLSCSLHAGNMGYYVTLDSPLYNHWRFQSIVYSKPIDALFELMVYLLEKKHIKNGLI